MSLYTPLHANPNSNPNFKQLSIICWGLGVVWSKVSLQSLIKFVASLTITNDISETNDSKKGFFTLI